MQDYQAIVEKVPNGFCTNDFRKTKLVKNFAEWQKSIKFAVQNKIR